MKAHTLFISDLHLEKGTPLVTAHFFHFMQHQAPNADATYILGDFFETWIGDDNQTPFNRKIIEVLQIMTHTKPVYFMRGNRDFLIGKKFAAVSGVILLQDPSIIQLYNRPVLLTHGDSLCTLDYKHQIYRRKIMKPWVQKLILSFPLTLRRKLAQKFREKSRRNHNQVLSFNIQDVTLEAMKKVINDHKVELLIHGHTHRPIIDTIRINEKSIKRIVLGSWHESGHVLRYYHDGCYELKSFKINHLPHLYEMGGTDISIDY